MSEWDARVHRAEDRLIQGDLEGAEALCAQVLKARPQHWRALNLMGRLCARLGLLAVAQRYLQRAVDAAGSDLEAARLAALDLATPADPPPRETPAEPRYLLLKSYGASLAADLHSVLGAALLGEVTGREVVWHWGENCLYGDGQQDAARRLLEPPTERTALDLMAPGLRYFPSKWSASNLLLEQLGRFEGEQAHLTGIYLLNRPEEVVVCDQLLLAAELLPFLPEEHPLWGQDALAAQRLLWRRQRVRPLLRAIADEFAISHLAGAPYAALHLPDDLGGDVAPQCARALALLEERPELRGTPWRLLAISCGPRALEVLRARCGERLVVPAPGTRGVRLGLAAMRELLLAERADVFVGDCRSAVSAAVAWLRDWPPGRFLDLAGLPLLGAERRPPRSLHADTQARDARYRRT